MKDKINKLILDIADSVSSNEIIAEQYLRENNVDINSFIQKGFKELKKNTAKASPAKLNKSQNFFRRVVLGAEIINQCHDEWTFGSVKFQKLLYLCEQASKMNFTTNYVKQAAGPFDHRFMHTFKAEFKKLKWYEITKGKGKFAKTNFTPLEKIDSYKKYFDRYYSEVKDDVQYVIDTFFKSKTDDVELVATIYYSCEEIFSNHQILSDKDIIDRVYKWHPKKKEKFTKEKIIETHNWMIEKGIYPQLT